MKTWVRPQGVVEEFVANEYVAACYYNFPVDGAAGGLYRDSNNNQAFDIGVDDRLTSMYIRTKHTENPSLNTTFFNGFLISDNEVKSVIIYKQGTGYYATTTPKENWTKTSS